MPFGIIGKDGKPVCPCCRDMLWHCEKCWRNFQTYKELWMILSHRNIMVKAWLMMN